MKKNAMMITLAGTLLVGGTFQTSLANSNSLQESEITSEINFIQNLEQAVTIKDHDLSFEKEEIAVNAVLPEIQGLKDVHFQGEINEKIKMMFEEKIEELEKDAIEHAQEAKESGWNFHKYSLDMSYDMKIAGDLVSIVIGTSTYTGGANATTIVDSVNIVNQSEAKEVSITELMEKDKINELILAEINKNPDQYFTPGDLGFQTVKEDQAYYIDREEVVLIFDEYEIAPGVAGTPYIFIPFVNERMDHKYSKDVSPSEEIFVVTNGEVQSFTQEPIIKNNTTMVPLRGIFEVLGAGVEWDQTTKTVKANKNDTEILLTIGDNVANVNGKSIILQHPSIVLNGSTMVPLRFVSEALGASVDWNQETKIVTIKTN
ncbi:stalk domain-containing protein [Chengkuizengella sediminis]|uniref:stalk domain-containing protein n=1 Tax=Chengkuizengella sediminis TaxID=1885917 RepID=UPI0013898107|nr:stalk domain-containing protein [Chengkuizengella sediminis]NDI36065.1 DUF3298 domain-containing protein [Chengkuizengella sediminis]